MIGTFSECQNPFITIALLLINASTPRTHHHAEAVSVEQPPFLDEVPFDVQQQQMQQNWQLLREQQRGTHHETDDELVDPAQYANANDSPIGWQSTRWDDKPKLPAEEQQNAFQRLQHVHRAHHHRRYGQLAMEEQLQREQAMSQSFLLLVAFCAVLFALTLSIVGFAIFYYVSIVHRGGFACWASGTTNTNGTIIAPGMDAADHRRLEADGLVAMGTSSSSRNGRRRRPQQYYCISISSTVVTLAHDPQQDTVGGPTTTTTLVGQQREEEEEDGRWTTSSSWP